MQVSKNTVVTIDYTLKDTEGKILDTSSEGDPISYVHGIGAIIPGLERALEGREAPESITVTIRPEEGYGPRDESLVQTVPRDLFDNVDDLQAGMRFDADAGGRQTVITILEVGDEEVKIDGNHPLAGESLQFDVTLVDVREAGEDELKQGLRS
jgi:FKBP-type peptidyl-prolyl cis-trans isomerase SlyD